MLPWQRFRKNALFLAQNVFILDFLVRIRNQRLKVDLTKGSSNFDLDGYRKLLDDFILTSVMATEKFYGFSEFVSECHYAKFGGKWTTNKGDTEGGVNVPCPPAYILPK